MTGEQAFDPLKIIRVLNRHGVRFVVIGGIAAGVQGAMWATTDLDVTYDREQGNHARLASALAELNAEPVELPPGVRVHLDARGLAAGDVWTLMTRYGRLDLLGEPAPGITYAALAARARSIHGDEAYLVATIEDLISMKQHAGRPKDRAQIELLRATLDELSAAEPATTSRSAPDPAENKRSRSSREGQ
jgi:hypothetical protein